MSTTTTTTITKSEEAETPFLTGARKSGSSVQFWKSYVQARPSPTEDFFDLIYEYHQSHGDSRTDIAHDVGTGPGNIAARLATRFNHVVGSDINESVLDAAPYILPDEILKRMTFVHSPAEALAQKTPAQVGGQGTTDLITVSECMPLLDETTALKAFHKLLRPGGTLGIYFYGPAVFVDGDVDKCNTIYDKIATRICTFNQPMKGTPGFPFHLRAAEALISEMDSIPMPAEDWESVERHKWNTDHSLLFNSKAGFDFDFSRVDRRTKDEVTKETINRNFWGNEWSIDNVKSYLDSLYPNYRDKAGARYAELETMFGELHAAMGGEKRKVTFPVVLILATKKDSSKLPKVNQVRISPEHAGLGRISESSPESIRMANQLLQKNHDEFHIFWRDLNGHNHMAHSILTTFALSASPSELQRAYDDGVGVQRPMPELDTEIVKGLSDDKNMRAIFGQLPHYTNVLNFFRQQIESFGWRAVLHKYCFNRTPLADDILSRMYEGAHHPFIHLGLAVEFELPSILAEALAQAVVHPYSGIPDCLLQSDVEATPLSSGTPHTPILELYNEARVTDSILHGARWEDGPFKMRDGTLGRSRANITSLAAKYRVDPSELELRAAEVINCSAYIAGASQRASKSPKIDFFHMHNVTSSIFLTVLVQDPWISLENKVRMVEWKARTDLFWYAACGCPEFDIQEVNNYQAGPSSGMGWSELYHAVNVMHDDGHVAKFVRALKSAEDICKPFEQQDPAAFQMKGDAWIQLARMSYDTTLDLAPEAKWVPGAGFEQAWAAVATRAPAAAAAPPPPKPRVFPSLTKKYHKTAYDQIDPTLPALSAAGKNIVVTGGGTGIGAATALSFAQAGAASISILGRRTELLESTKSHIESLVPGAQVHTYGTDATQKDAVNETFQTINERVGKIHVLVNNHGYKPKVAPKNSAIKDIDVEEWWKCFEVNIKGAFNITQAFLQYNSDDAVVVYVTTALSHFDGFPNSSSYSSSKAGGVRVFSTLQAEHPELRVVCLHPGVVNTGVVRDAKVAGMADDVSLPGGVMVWLACPEAAFLKGKYIWANWDVSEMKARAEEIAGGDLLTMKLSGWPFPYKSA
ncbi:Nn.00g077290.m01.CDS01 [Neocucurbitaria sp. VM-36]